MTARQYTVVSGALLRPDAGWLIAKRAHIERAFPNCWEFPGGKVDEGEFPTRALVREWKEELDLDVEVASGVVARCMFQPPGFDDVDISLYVLRLVDGAPFKLRLSVHDAVRCVELDGLHGLLRSPITAVTPSTHHFAAMLSRRIANGERWST